MDCMMFSSWWEEQGDKALSKLQVEAEVLPLNVRLKRWKAFEAEDLLACLQELLDGDHSVIVPVHFLEKAAGRHRCFKA